MVSSEKFTLGYCQVKRHLKQNRNIHEGELQKLSALVTIATAAVTGQAIRSAGFALALDKISAEDRDFVNPVA